ncbi:MAG: hypothetical protein RLZZ383_244 [Pseudomonadota bacterium]
MRVALASFAVGIVAHLGACTTGVPADAPEPRAEVRLSPARLAVRTSMAIRGRLPSLAELDAVERDPAALTALTDAWLESAEFLEVVKDYHAELLLVRADVVDPLPALGPLQGVPLSTIFEAHSEEPLELAAHLVADHRPYTALLQSETMWTNETLAALYGLAWDPAGAPWQETTWSDLRPRAGLLSSAELWRRHESAGSNFQRLRANFLADAFLCESFANRDIVVGAEVTISDELAVSDAVRTDPGCVACHQGLDPLASFLWGFHGRFKGNFAARAYADGCDEVWDADAPTEEPPSSFCYPIRGYLPEARHDWQMWNLRPPAFYGQPGDDLADLGEMMTADPRFAMCAARRWSAWITQREPDDVPFAEVVALRDAFAEADFELRALVRAIVTQPAFGRLEGPEATIPMLLLRPESYARTIEAETGFSWRAVQDLPSCRRSDDAYGSTCWGEIDLMRSDRFGFRSMFGGVDGNLVTRATHTATPTRELVGTRFALEAAAFAFDRDRAATVANRRLLPAPDDPDAVAGTLTGLLRRFLGETPDASTLASFNDLWQDAHQRASAEGDRDPMRRAWVLTLAAVFLDPKLWWV